MALAVAHPRRHRHGAKFFCGLYRATHHGEKLAEAAGAPVPRVYQIRDGRR
jgi:hypothetical protein